jgi:hypothetical protein
MVVVKDCEPSKRYRRSRARVYAVNAETLHNPSQTDFALAERAKAPRIFKSNSR